MNPCGLLACMAILAVCGSTASAAIRNTRTGSTYTTVQSAVSGATSGDTIEIDGTYTGSVVFASITKNLTIRGVGSSRAVLDGNLTCPNNHGILDINGGQTITIENIDLRNCQGASGGNGCGIRLSSPQNLTIRNCYFYNNENGIMGANGGVANITVESCEFNYNGFGDLGHTHNIYIGDCNSFTMRYSYSHNAHVGHEVKTRAHTSYILYNRIGNEAANPDGQNASYEIDVPQGGTTYLIGNTVQQGPNTSNSTIIAFAEEGMLNADQHLYVINNTVVNTRGSGTFVWNASTTTALVQNNIFQGTGTIINGPATSLNNWVTANASLLNPSAYDYHLTASSTGAIDLGGTPSPGTGISGFSLIPVSQYVHPLSYLPRPVHGTIDIGAYEYNLAPTVDAGASITAVYENQPVALHATASDLDGDSLTYAWTQTAGQAVVSPSGASAADYAFTTPVLTSRAGGTMTLRTDVADGYGGTANDSVSVQVYMTGDTNQDWFVNVSDLQALVAAWASGPGYTGTADLNSDGYVNVGDLQLLVANWGRSL